MPLFTLLIRLIKSELITQKLHSVCDKIDLFCFFHLSCFNKFFWYILDKMISNEALKGVPLLLVCNKQDIQVCLLLTYLLNKLNQSYNL